MRTFLVYWFWPNPGGWQYADPKVAIALAGCGALILLSFIIKYWRGQLQSSITRSLTSSWSTVLFWFGLLGVIFIICRVEMIQFMAMRLLWLLWALSLGLYALYQLLRFRRRHYVLLDRVKVLDERDKYLPRKK